MLKEGVEVPHPVLDTKCPRFVARTGNLTGTRRPALIALRVTHNHRLASQVLPVEKSRRNEKCVEVAMHYDLFVFAITGLFLAFL